MIIRSWALLVLRYLLNTLYWDTGSIGICASQVQVSPDIGWSNFQDTLNFEVLPLRENFEAILPVHKNNKFCH